MSTSSKSQLARGVCGTSSRGSSTTQEMRCGRAFAGCELTYKKFKAVPFCGYGQGPTLHSGSDQD